MVYTTQQCGAHDEQGVPARYLVLVECISDAFDRGGNAFGGFQRESCVRLSVEGKDPYSLSSIV